MNRVIGDVGFGGEEAVMEDDDQDVGGERAAAASHALDEAVVRTPISKARSLSDGGGTPGPKLSPSPHIVEAARRASKDDSSIVSAPLPIALPVTPRRPDFSLRGMTLPRPQPAGSSGLSDDTTPVKPVPLSPKLDHSQIYASPILPRHSRGLDFSRAATSLHHSMLAEQSSPESSPIVGGPGRAMNIPQRGRGGGGIMGLMGGGVGAGPGIDHSGKSLWSLMGNQERIHISGSLGSGTNLCSESSSSSDEDALMDDGMDETYVTTPQTVKVGTPTGPANPWMRGGSPAVNSLLSFQQRQRPRKQNKKKTRGGAIVSVNTTNPTGLSKSPPSNITTKEIPVPHARRESISWAANQLHISGNETDDSLKSQMDNVEGLLVTPGRDGQKGVIRRVVTRRGNLLPKTKNFARVRASLMEEGAPIETEFRREAEVVRQVRESDMDLEPRVLPTTSPQMAAVLDSLDSISDDAMVMDSGFTLSSSFKQQAMKNSKGTKFWDTFSESSSVGAGRITPPPAAFLPRGSSSGISNDDINMDSPTAAPASVANQGGSGMGMQGYFPFPVTTTSSSGGDTPQAGASASGGSSAAPSAAEITRRINSKRRRDDDFDPISFKRRAVSPGMSVHNSPIMQSPLQRDNLPWGASRPGSNGQDRSGGSGAPSENGSQGAGGSNGERPGGGRLSGGKGRVGYQGMVDTNDGITRLSIE